MNSLTVSLLNQLKQLKLEQYNLDNFQEKESINTLVVLDGILKQLAESLKEDQDSRSDLKERILHLSENLCWLFRLYLISFVMLEYSDATLMERFEEDITVSTDIPTLTKYYYQQQCECMIFLHPELVTAQNQGKCWNILSKVTEEYLAQTGEDLHLIPYEERDHNFVIVLTDQFVAFEHGPTKTTADRCKILMERMNKKVLLINTGDCLSSVNRVPFWDARMGSYDESKINLDSVEWKECRIPYFQCERNMPDAGMISVLLQMIQKRKPAYIVSIGSAGLFGALAAKLVPTLCIGLSPSALSFTGAQYQTFSGHLRELEKEILHIAGMPESSVIEALFTSSILKQREDHTREEYGLTDDDFVIALVGARLEDELTDEFWEVMSQVTDEKVKYLLLGGYSAASQKRVEDQFPVLCGKICNLGFVNDILSHLTLCNLYINPKRRGGGTSAVESLSIGLPVLCVDYGDVYFNVGDDFAVSAYDEMPEKVQQYRGDEVFYRKQSELARRRAKRLLDSEGEFLKLMSDFEEKAKLYR